MGLIVQQESGWFVKAMQEASHIAPKTKNISYFTLAQENHWMSENNHTFPSKLFKLFKAPKLFENHGDDRLSWF